MYMFNDRERRVVQELDEEYSRIYRRDPGSPASSMDLVYFLGDNPSFSRTWSAYSGRLPCFRRNKGFYLHRVSGRVLTPIDKVTPLGWPTTARASDNMLTSRLPALDTKRAELMAGNAMLLGNCAVVILVGLACFKKVSDKSTDWMVSTDTGR